MNQEQRKVYLKRSILDILNTSGSYLTPESALYSQSILIIDPAPTRIEFDETIRSLAADLFITNIRDAFGTTKWKITDTGRSVL